MKLPALLLITCTIGTINARIGKTNTSNQNDNGKHGNDLLPHKRVNGIDVPHHGCMLLLNDREPPHKKLIGKEFEKRGAQDYKVANEAGTTAAQCINGFAGGYPCNNVDLLSMLDIATLDDAMGNSNSANDIWGWTDINSGREFALIGVEQGTAFVEITNPVNPIYVGGLPTRSNGSNWRDIKTFGTFAFIVSEEYNHGMQIIDLTKLLTASTGTTFNESVHYSNFGNAHNIFINEGTSYAYVVGSNTCSGGLHIVDISDVYNPVFAGCYSDDGYTHDVQCIIYDGPDSAYNGKEICFCSNEDTITVVDVTDKMSPSLLSRKSYNNDYYTHQGWLTEDHSHFLFNDELDEYNGVVSKTATHVMDVSDLNNINYIGKYSGRTSAIDHNHYVKGDYLYQANYRAGFNVLKITNVTNAEFEEAGYFDIYPNSDSSRFNGAWSNYPYFPSGNIVVSGIEEGLFVLKFNEDKSTLSSAPTSAPSIHPSHSDPWWYVPTDDEFEFDYIPSAQPSSVPSFSPSFAVSGGDPTSIAPSESSMPPSGDPTTPSECSLDEILFTMNLQTDGYGADTTWKLEINARGKYWDLVARNAMSYENSSIYQKALCIPKGECFRFIISDAAEDGLCCNYSKGYYNIFLGSQLVKYSIYANKAPDEITLFGTDGKMC